MKRPAHALDPGPGEVWLRRAVFGYVVLLVAVPLMALSFFALREGIGPFYRHVTDPVALSAVWLTLWTGALVAACNGILGTMTAWVLVRYPIPGKKLLSAVIDLPLAIPTLVAGVMLAILYGPSSVLGARFQAWGIDVIFARPGIVLALLLVTLPFVARAVEAVLSELDPAEEEAAAVLGAGPIRTFWTVHLPAILPAALSGSLRSFGRAMGEFGSIVVVAGNIPEETLTAPVFIFGEIESGRAASAAAIGTVLLLVAISLHAGARALERVTGARHVEQ